MQTLVEVVVSFLAGSVTGTLIKIAYDKWASRQQPILRGVQVDRIFGANADHETLPATLSVRHQGEQFAYENLSLVKITIQNQANVDFSSFEFGVTVNGGRIILSECNGADRHHEMLVSGLASPNSQKLELDFRCVPFNRKDRYVAKLFVTADPGMRVSESDIVISTKAPIRFVEQPAAQSSKAREDSLQWTYLVASFTATMLGMIISMMIFIYFANRTAESWKNSIRSPPAPANRE